MERAVGQGVQDALEAGDRLVGGYRVVAGAQGGQLVVGGAEDVGVVLTHGVQDLDVRPVQRAQRQRPVHHELHVRGTRGLLTGHRDLLGDVGGRDDVLSRGDVVVVDEDDLDRLGDHGVVVDELSDGVDELDDGLGPDVAGGGLGTEDEDALGHLQRRVLLHPEVQVQDVQGVEELALVLVQALDLDVEDGVRVDLHALASGHPGSEVHLVGVLDLRQAVQDGLVCGVGVLSQDGQVPHPLVRAGDLVQQGGQTRVALAQPAARGHAIGLVVEALGPDRVPLLEGVTLDDLGVQRGHAVDGVGGVAGDPGHVDHAAVDRGHVVDGALVHAALGQIQAEATVDLVDDLQHAREQALEDGDLPGLQGLGQHGVVGVGEGLGDLGPGVVPAQAVLVHEDAHELGDGEHRVGVIELDGVVVGESAQVLTVVGHVVLDDLLQGGGAEEVLLAHAQELALVGGVIGVEDAGDVRGPLALDDRVGKALGVEGVVVELLHALGLPQAQGAHVLRAVAGDRHVVGDGAHGQVVVTDDALSLLTTDDEGVALFHPGVGVLGLETVREELLEQAVAVEDAVAGHRQVQGGAGVKEAGGQAAQASVAQCCVRLLLQDVAEVAAEGVHGLGGLVNEPEVGQVVEQGASHEELGGEVVLHAAGPVALLGGVPVVRDGIDDGGRQPLPDLHLRGGASGVPGNRPHLRGHGGGQVLRHCLSLVHTTDERC